jgi:signal transduction histidine kinase
LPNSTTLIAGGLVAGYGLFLLFLVGRSRERQNIGARRRLMLTLVAALAGAALLYLPSDAHSDSRYESLFIESMTQPALVIIAANLMLVLFGVYTLRYLESRLGALWMFAGLAWWGAQVAASLLADTLSIGQEGWYRQIYDPVEWPNVLAFVGWLAIGVILVLAALYAFYRARLSELANQALFAALLVPLVVSGVALGMSGENILAEIGWLVQAIGLAGAVYAVSAYRVFDIRRLFRRTIATGTLTVITGVLFFVALVIAHQINTDSDALYLVLGALALAVALVYVPFRLLVQAGINRFVGGSRLGVSQLMRKFTEDITGVVELDALVDVTMHTLSHVMRVRRGGLLLVTGETDQVVMLEPFLHGLGEIPDIQGQIACGYSVYNQLVKSRFPLLQYDLDFGPSYMDTPPEERRFFQQMRMSAYAPIILQGQLIGILCCGAKVTDDPFTEYDLELLMTLANQTGVALRNARLVADLRRREAEQAELNKAISATKEQLERLDSVKTDFITIASHELRTPLAQIRGYTDIMEAMNEQGLLDQDQVAGMTNNLRKAADRLENLIGAMLDVSQLDVDAMDLRFTQTTAESIMRTAIEPLQDAIKQRKLMLSARGLRDLPRIQADTQRLVQAFRNVVLNAIKYTPDGGRIDISGHQQDGEILISIKDSGIGIDPKNHELIFEKFFRAHDPSLHSTGATKFMGAGPGLGLTIARGVIAAHGGRIWVESDGYDPEQFPGSIFYIALPLVPPEGITRIAPFESTVSLSVAALQEMFGTDRQPADSSPTLPAPPAGLRG